MKFYFMLREKNMPNRDKMGPQGDGPKTGRGLGDCKGEESRQSVKRDESNRGLGLGRRRGGGRGLGRNRNN